MTFEQIDFSEVPQRLLITIDREFMRWEAYEPTTIEADIPFKKSWWKYVYWIPKIKKELYLIALSQGEDAVWEKLGSYGTDELYFRENYNDFVRRIKWMIKNNKHNELGEVP